MFAHLPPWGLSYFVSTKEGFPMENIEEVLINIRGVGEPLVSQLRKAGASFRHRSLEKQRELRARRKPSNQVIGIGVVGRDPVVYDFNATGSEAILLSSLIVDIEHTLGMCLTDISMVHKEGENVVVMYLIFSRGSQKESVNEESRALIDQLLTSVGFRHVTAYRNDANMAINVGNFAIGSRRISDLHITLAGELHHVPRSAKEDVAMAV